MTAVLTLGPGLSLPLSLVTEPIGVLANRGRGKSSTTRVLVEEMHDAAVPVVVLDVKGDWWGIRSSSDGTEDGLPFIIFGGDHADLPLEVGSGELLADLVVDERVSVVLDMSALSKSRARTFATSFAERLYHRNRDPLFLVVDEADVLIPQRATAETARLLGAMEDLAKRGRGRGIGMAVVTQRPQEVAKSVLDLMDTLILLGMTGPRSLKSVREWISVHVDEDTSADDVMASLPSLAVGQAWVWSPMQHMLKELQVRRIRTFDSHATPQPGQVRRTPRGRADVDLEALGERIAATVERAKAQDPRELMRRIAALEGELARARSHAPEPVVKNVEVPVVDEETIARLTASVDALLSHGESVVCVAKEVHEALTRWQHSSPASGGAASTPAPTVDPVQAAAPAVVRRSARTPSGAEDTSGDVVLGKTERNILTVLARHGVVSHGQLALLSGYSPKASTIGVALGKLRKVGYAEAGQPYRATEAGLDFIADSVEPLPVGRDLLEFWRHRFGQTERNVLDAVLSAHPRETSQVEIATLTGYSPTASTIGVALGKLRKVGVVDRWRISADFASAVGLVG